MNDAIFNPLVYDAHGVLGRAPTRARTGYVNAIREAQTDAYLLGDRVYSPTLRRFLKADSLSPFGAGGVNRYAYCNGDPIGRIDPGGQQWLTWVHSIIDSIALPVTNGVGRSGAQYSFATPTVSNAILAPRNLIQLRRGSPGRSITGEERAGLIERANKKMLVRQSTQAQLRPFKNELGVVWPHTGDTASSTIFRSDFRVIHVIQGRHPFHGDNERSSLAEKGRVKPHWLKKTNGSQGVHLAATTRVGRQFLNQLKLHIDHAYRGRPVTILAGAHGRPNGMNWSLDGRREGPDREFYDIVKQKISELHWNASLLDYSDLDVDAFRDLLQHGTGVFIHLTCFGAADALFMEAFHMDNVTIRYLGSV